MDEQQTYAWIEQYLAGELEGEALAEFEGKMRDDADFRAEVALHRGVENAIQDADALHFSQLLAEADQSYFANQAAGAGVADPPTGKVIAPFWRQTYSIAAAVLILAIVGGVFFLRNTNKSSPEELYATYFTTYDAASTWRAEDPVLDLELKAAFEAYDAKNFDAANKAFAGIAAQDSNNVTARFYLSVSAMAAGDVAQAVPQLKKLVAEAGHPFRTQARWYLAMAHLKSAQVEAAVALLNELAAGRGKYQQLAAEVLKKM